MLRSSIESKNVAIVPAGAFGSALAVVASENGHQVSLIFRNPEDVLKYQSTLRTSRLPNIKQARNVKGVARWDETIASAEVIILSSPSDHLREVASRVLPNVQKGTRILIATKGLELATQLRMSEVLLSANEESKTPIRDLVDNIAVISGPSLAQEVGRKEVTGSVVAAYDGQTSEFFQRLLTTGKFKIYRTDDIKGVEYAGALKNIMALGAGMARRLRAGHNARAFFFTQAQTEITRLGTAYGGQPETFSGLAGLGDWYLSSSSAATRNSLAGELLAEGKSIDEIKRRGLLAEGLSTIEPAYQLAKGRNLDTPIIYALHEVLFEGRSIKDAVSRFMGEEAGSESKSRRSPRFYLGQLYERFTRRLLLRRLTSR